MVPAVAPELARRMTDFRLSEATCDLVTYCASCRARLAKTGHPTLHVLDLPFNPAWQQTKTPAAAPLPDPLVAALAAETAFSKFITKNENTYEIMGLSTAIQTAK